VSEEALQDEDGKGAAARLDQVDSGHEKGRPDLCRSALRDP